MTGQGRNAILRVLIAGGGTGGHIIPALAVADELRSRPEGAEILFLGTPRGLESRLVPAAGYPLELVEVGQLKNVSLATRARTLLDLPKALLHARSVLRRFHPQVVVGVGGYASGPAMAAAVMAGVPTLAFEPNAAPGLANRLVGRRVSAAAVNFAPAARYFRNAQVTGIPVRQAFFDIAPRPHSGSQNLLVFGGSQGARVFNQRMPHVIAELLSAYPSLHVLHQSGARAAVETQSAYAASGADPARWQVSAFLDDMPARFAAADLILARSGASTVAELCAAGKPSLLVPFPLAADNHQLCNAEVLAQAGAAKVIEEKDLTADTLVKRLKVMLATPDELDAMGARSRTLARADARAVIAGMVHRLAGTHAGKK